MISKDEVLKLAELARLRLAEGEVEGLQKDISNILEYVGQVSQASQGDNQGSTLDQDSPRLNLSKASPLALHTVMREDVPSGVLGEREGLLKAFPKREGDFNVVRKIIQKDE